MRKLLHLKTTRILDIIGYQATESDSKRLEFAVGRFGGRAGASVLYESKRGSEMGNGNELAQFFGADNALMIEKKIEQLGSGLPYLDSDLQKLQKEILGLVQQFSDQKHAVQDSSTREEKYEKKITSLLQELKAVKNNDQPTKMMKSDDPFALANDVKPKMGNRKKPILPVFRTSNVFDRDEKKINLTKLRSNALLAQILANKHPGEDSDVPYLSDNML